MKLSFFTFLFLVPLLAFGQSDYFQQELHYTIEAKLKDSTHTLLGNEKLVYTNHSPDTLYEIYWHLWANAYQNNETAFARQQVRYGNTDFYFAEAEERGGYQKVRCNMDGKVLPLEVWKEHPDIQISPIPQGILPGETVTFQFDFEIRIPKSFSRMGRAGNSYQMTQWYPKPAVYDRDGWHPMPYLDQGEFFSEFGSYDVSISLPAKYVIAATGRLQSPEERSWLLAKSNKSPTSEKDKAVTKSALREGLKTVRYTAENVHDFAWFVDLNFHVRHQKVKLQNRDSLDIWAFFTDREAHLWERATEYLERAVRFYSDEIGTYPYPQVTAVEGALSAGAGMEYPMITIIGNSGDGKLLDEVITHEVGHNWWYGILASNERDEPWIDEGINSMYEHLYMHQYYPSTQTDFEEILAYEGMDGWWLWDIQSGRKRDQAPSTPSDALSDLNYYLSAYWKPAQAFLHLYHLDTAGQFRSCMKEFYKRYAFNHIYPEDLQTHFESCYGSSLKWLFQDMIQSNASADYSLKKVKKDKEEISFQILQKGSVYPPINLGLFQAGRKSVLYHNLDINEDKIFTISLPDSTEGIMINPGKYLPEDDIGNNLLKIKNGRVKRRSLSYGFLTGLVSPFEEKLFFTPSLGYNYYDGFQIGLWIHNVGIPDRAFQFSVAPFFGTSSGRLNGIANFRHRWFMDKGPFQNISLGLDGKSFSYFTNEIYDFNHRFLKIAPYLQFTFDHTETDFWRHRIQLRSVWLQQEVARGISATEGLFEKDQQVSWIQQLQFHSEYKHPIRPFQGLFIFEQSVAGQRLSLELNQAWQYQQSKFFRARIFGGALFQTGKGQIQNILIANGNTGLAQRDYLFDEILLGRSETEGFLSQQIFTRDGSLKTRANNLFSDRWLTGLGVELDLPIPVPLMLYADMALFDQPVPNGYETQFAFSSGLAISLLNKTLEIYFPIYENDLITNSLTYRNAPGYFQRVSFQLNLNQWGVFHIKEQLNLY